MRTNRALYLQTSSSFKTRNFYKTKTKLSSNTSRKSSSTPGTLRYFALIQLLNGIKDASYMINCQRDINEKMRSILIDWLVDVHLKFKLNEETFFLTVNLIDRYLEKSVIPRTKLQLVGVAAMFMACKYEEIFSPELKDFVYVCDKAYTKEEILEMESLILTEINFEMG